MSYPSLSSQSQSTGSANNDDWFTPQTHPHQQSYPQNVQSNTYPQHVNAAASAASTSASASTAQHHQPSYPQHVNAYHPQQHQQQAAYDPNAYYNQPPPPTSTSPYPQSQTQTQYNTHQQPQHPQQGSSHFQGSFPPVLGQQHMANNFFTSPMASVGMQFANQYGQQFMQSSGIQTTWQQASKSAFNLKYYFAVNNSYVLRKLKVLLLPILHKSWSRKYDDVNNPMNNPMQTPMANNTSSTDTSSVVYRIPREDLNAPDLYIPLMAFITYVLVMGYTRGLERSFTPEVLGMTGSTTLVLLLLEVLALKAGFYLISTNTSTTPSLLDLTAYCSYKYVTWILIIAIGLMLGSLPYYVTLLFFGSMNAFFMMRTLGRSLVRNEGAIGHADHNVYGDSTYSSTASNSRRNTFLLFVGVAQILLTWIGVRKGWVYMIPTPNMQNLANLGRSV